LLLKKSVSCYSNIPVISDYFIHLFVHSPTPLFIGFDIVQGLGFFWHYLKIETRWQMTDGCTVIGWEFILSASVNESSRTSTSHFISWLFTT